MGLPNRIRALPFYGFIIRPYGAVLIYSADITVFENQRRRGIGDRRGFPLVLDHGSARIASCWRAKPAKNL